ncbi:unnamed protein product, partial [Thlaspi arvense]
PVAVVLGQNREYLKEKIIGVVRHGEERGAEKEGLPSHNSYQKNPKDCVRAEPVFYKKLEASSDDVALLRAYVGDRPTWKNPQHPWRHDPRFKLTGVPTLIRWEGEAIKGRLDDHEAILKTKLLPLLHEKKLISENMIRKWAVLICENMVKMLNIKWPSNNYIHHDVAMKNTSALTYSSLRISQLVDYASTVPIAEFGYSMTALATHYLSGCLVSQTFELCI